MSITLEAARRSLIQEYGLGVAGTATAASTTTLTDMAELGGAQGGSMFPNGAPIRITSGAAIGLEARKQGIVASTGVLTFDRTVAGNTGTPTYVIVRDIDRMGRIDESFRRAQTRRCTRWIKVPFTSIPDGDFLGQTITDFWTVSAGPPTQAYTTLSMANGQVQRVLQLTTAGTNQYTESQSIPVRPLETRRGYLIMRGANTTPTTVNTAEIIIRDATNGATITPVFQKGAASSSSRSFINIYFTYTVPAGCSQVRWRLNGQESGAVVQFGNCIDIGDAQHIFETQPHLRTPNDMGGFYQLHLGTDALSRAEENWFTPIDEDGVLTSGLGFAVQVSLPERTWPYSPLIFYDELAFFPAFTTSDTDTTDCDEELLIAGAAVELFSYLERGEFKRPETNGVSQWTLLLERANENWRRVARLRARRKVSIKRTYQPAVSA